MWETNTERMIYLPKFQHVYVLEYIYAQNTYSGGHRPEETFCPLEQELQEAVNDPTQFNF